MIYDLWVLPVVFDSPRMTAKAIRQQKRLLSRMAAFVSGRFRELQ